MSEKQISNEMADKLLKIIYSDHVPLQCKKIKDEWKQAGYIEESDLEKARRLKRELLGGHIGQFTTKNVSNMVEAYEDVLTKLEARIKELEEGKNHV